MTPNLKEPGYSKPVSSLGIKYPKFRDHPLHSTYLWLESKRVDDGAEGLWRIHDSLYDFTEFIRNHPGGQDWLKVTKGTDITEAFETHHISGIPETRLKNYFIRKTKLPRNSPFTFNENDFYKVLKKKVNKKLKTLSMAPVQRSKYLTDLFFISYICMALLAVYFRSFTIGAASGIALGLTAVAAHNYFHQKDNFRMYYFNFTMMQAREMRISHALSHHLYTNTINDLEISAAEPFLQYMPTKKTFFFRYISWFYWPLYYALMYITHLLFNISQKAKNGEVFNWDLLLPFTVPVAMFVLTSDSILFCITMFMWITAISSIYFSAVALNAGHHHPKVFHDGDTTRPKEQMDWGIYQLDAVMDNKDITGSHFRVLTSFGDHALHHLFPTVDHGLLEHLYPEFLETCKEFGIEYKMYPRIELVKGQFQQLARVEPNKIAPGSWKNLR